MNRLVTLSGCSGGGKSTLLEELGRRGYATVEEPGRRIVVQEQKSNGSALPWVNPKRFAERAIEMSLEDLDRWKGSSRWVFFDRGLVDACSALASVSGKATNDYLERKPKYHQTAFLTPPWEEIYSTDEQRTHSLNDAIVEYERLLKDYPAAGYEVVILERTAVSNRADAVLESLGISG